MAYRRSGGTGGQRAVLCGDRGGVGGVCEEISGSEASRRAVAGMTERSESQTREGESV